MNGGGRVSRNTHEALHLVTARPDWRSPHPTGLYVPSGCYETKEEEEEAIKTMFEELDADDSGALDRIEVAELGQKLWGELHM